MYEELKAKCLNPLLDLEHNNPLSSSEDWLTNRDMKTQIQVDIGRIEGLLADQRGMMVEMLTVWTALNPDVGYRQGMHEILHTILVMNPDILEESIFKLYVVTMERVKIYYERDEIRKASESLMERLQFLDKSLYKRMSELQIESQVFLTRWLRLMYAREFDTLYLKEVWAAVLKDNGVLLEWIALALLIGVRDILMREDYNGCITLLMRPFPAMSGILDKALSLRDFHGKNTVETRM